MVFWCPLLLLLLHSEAGEAAAKDLVFRVPEVTVRHAAADRPVGATRRHANDSSPEAYEEYFVEHAVSIREARRAARDLDLDEQALYRSGCGPCGVREYRYCESHVVADHCCCERRYLRDPFPWVPHVCYAGATRCRPKAADCAHYARLRDCCCRRDMAAKWRSILVGAGDRQLPTLALLLLIVIPCC